jgi:tetratricopeptide (TPR) repeat protein
LKSIIHQYNGDSLSEIGNYKDAIIEYKLALKNNSLIPYNIYYSLSYCYRMLQQDNLARVTLIKACNLGYKRYLMVSLENDDMLQYLKQDTNYNKIYSEIIENNKKFIDSDISPKYPLIRDSLSILMKLDQKYRKNLNNDSLWQLQKIIDDSNKIYVEYLLKTFKGIPDYLDIGQEAVRQLMLILIHSTDTKFQKRVIKYAKILVKHNLGVTLWNYALLIDKYSMRKKGYQIFGTQIQADSTGKDIELKPVKTKFLPYLDKIHHCYNFITIEQYLNDMRKR